MFVSVEKVIQETPEAVTIYFDDPDRLIRYRPGQFLTVSAQINRASVSRSYSLCTSPYVDPQPAITVKRLPGGVMSTYLVEHLRPGDLLEVQEPRGSFTTEINPEKSRHLVLFAGGSGITPLLSLAHSVLHQEPRSQVSLIYANRYQEGVLFKDRLLSMQHIFQGRFKVLHILKFVEDLPLRDIARGMQYLHGRLQPDLVENLVCCLTECHTAHNEYFICGPEGMMRMVADTLRGMLVPDASIHLERFRVAYQEPAGGVLQGAGQPVTLRLERAEHRIWVSPDQTILQAAAAQGVTLPHSCREGLCGSCQGKVLQGQVRMNHNYALPDEDLAKGYVLTCTGRPLTPDVVLDFTE